MSALNRITTASFLVLGVLPLIISAEDISTRPQRQLRPMLKIVWSRGPNLPQGFQDNDGGIIGTELITVGGFCSGGLKEDNRRKPGRYPRGFLKKAWSLDLSDPKPGWRPLPEFPGAARQGLSAARVANQLYFWGGFSYSRPFCYNDGWRLSKQGPLWKWDALPPLPWSLSSSAMAVIGTKIYLFGGADYDAKQFYTDTDRAGHRERLGARMLVLDVTQLKSGWRELPSCPGTPRWVHAMAVVSGKLYVIGGATGNTVRKQVNYGYCTVVDNWSFDPQTEQWKRLRDLPISSGNFPRSTNCVFNNRYIVLPGGYQYGYVRNPDGTIRDKYGLPSSANPKNGLYNNVFVYDVLKNNFGTADELPIDNNLPMTVVRGDEIYLLGGETGGGIVEGEYYGHHPDLTLRGKITEIKSGE